MVSIYFDVMLKNIRETFHVLSMGSLSPLPSTTNPSFMQQVNLSLPSLHFAVLKRVLVHRNQSKDRCDSCLWRAIRNLLLLFSLAWRRTKRSEMHDADKMGRPTSPRPAMFARFVSHSSGFHWSRNKQRRVLLFEERYTTLMSTWFWFVLNEEEGVNTRVAYIRFGVVLILLTLTNGAFYLFLCLRLDT